MITIRFRNSTDIPDKIIAVAVARALSALPRGNEIEIDEIVIKNKKDGKEFGQWGWYFPGQKRIVLIVPRTWTSRTVRKRYLNVGMVLHTRYDFVIAVMAHELRHAWQYQIDGAEKWKASRFAREVDAEMFESQQIREWHGFTRGG